MKIYVQYMCEFGVRERIYSDSSFFFRGHRPNQKNRMMTERRKNPPIYSKCSEPLYEFLILRIRVADDTGLRE